MRRSQIVFGTTRPGIRAEKDFRLRLLLAVMLLALAASRVRAQEVAAPVPAPRADFHQPPQIFQMTGTCAMEVSPDVAVIVGGVAVSSLKPTEANEQLDKQLALIRKYVEENHGRL